VSTRERYGLDVRMRYGLVYVDDVVVSTERVGCL
jgi:hypothetical protein